MLQSVRAAVRSGLPTVAECGGFLYLQQSLEDADRCAWGQVGLLPGKGFKTDRLQRFGYCNLVPRSDSLLFRKGEVIPAHEFHYWDCTDNGSALELRKPHSDRSWQCGLVTPTLYAAFPHLHFGGSVPLAQRFIAAAARHRQENL
jgi:cobyrinic acid a,c-diamide synthase